MQPSGISEPRQELERMFREAEGLYANYSGLSEFSLWHATCRGRLQNFRQCPKALEAWELLNLDFITDLYGLLPKNETLS